MSETTETTVRTPKQVAANGATAAEVRTWARGNGHEVGTRGTLASSVLDAYNAANPA